MPLRVINVQQGFFDRTGFHPIRSGRDYDPTRLEEPEYALRRKSKRKPKPTGQWIDRAQGKRKRNVAAGFYDEFGTFHPIRASYHYDRSRGGERKKRKGKSKTKAKRSKR